MKKMLSICLVLVTLSICTSPAIHAADLQAGWYVNVSGVHVYLYDWNGVPRLATSGEFYDTSPGWHGPFFVADTPSYRREVSVPVNAYGASPGESLVMPLYIPLAQGQRIAFLEMAVSTNYDPAHMYLDFWRTRNDGTDQLLWTQRLGGARGWSGNLAYDTYIEGPYFFKVTVVPEPSSLVSLAIPLIIFVPRLRRRA